MLEEVGALLFIFGSWRWVCGPVGAQEALGVCKSPGRRGNEKARSREAREGEGKRGGEGERKEKQEANECHHWQLAVSPSTDINPFLTPLFLSWLLSH